MPLSEMEGWIQAGRNQQRFPDGTQRSSMRGPAIYTTSTGEHTIETSKEAVSKKVITAQPPYPPHHRAGLASN